MWFLHVDMLKSIGWMRMEWQLKRSSYKHSTSSLLAAHHRLAATGHLANPHPLGGSGVTFSYQSQGGLPAAVHHWAYSFILMPTSAYWCSTSLVLGINSWPQATSLPTPVAQGQIPAKYYWLDSGSWPPLCWPSSWLLLDVNRQLPRPPLYRHSPLSGQLHTAKNVCRILQYYYWNTIFYYAIYPPAVGQLKNKKCLQKEDWL